MDFLEINLTHNQLAKSLPRSSYTDSKIFEKERHSLFRSLPIMASPSCALQNTGNYTVTETSLESVITIRDKDDTIKAMANTCRHRGKRLLEKKAFDEKSKIKSLKSIVCPYHAWKYDLNGDLVLARGDDSVISKGLCLRKLKIQETGGLTFYHGNNENFPHLNELNKVLGPFSLEEGKISATKTYKVKANWKLWTENFLECWHCASSHPELGENKGFIHQFENGREDLYINDDITWREKGLKLGWEAPEEVDFLSDNEMFYFHMALPLKEGNLTGSKTGERLGPALGKAEGMEGGAIFGCMGPFLFYLAYADYVVLFCVRPVNINETDIEVFWVTSKEFNKTKEELTWLWDTTLQQDIKLVEETQKGVSSLYYTPGPFQADEYRTQAFTVWWKNWHQKNKF